MCIYVEARKKPLALSEANLNSFLTVFFVNLYNFYSYLCKKLLKCFKYKLIFTLLHHLVCLIECYYLICCFKVLKFWVYTKLCWLRSFSKIYSEHFFISFLWYLFTFTGFEKSSATELLLRIVVMDSSFLARVRNFGI